MQSKELGLQRQTPEVAPSSAITSQRARELFHLLAPWFLYPYNSVIMPTVSPTQHIVRAMKVVALVIITLKCAVLSSFPSSKSCEEQMNGTGAP